MCITFCQRDINKHVCTYSKSKYSWHIRIKRVYLDVIRSICCVLAYIPDSIVVHNLHLFGHYLCIHSFSISFIFSSLAHAFIHHLINILQYWWKIVRQRKLYLGRNPILLQLHSATIYMCLCAWGQITIRGHFHFVCPPNKIRRESWN